MLVLAIVGKIGAGKDTASEYLCGRYGFVFVSYSGIVHDKGRERGMEPTRNNLQRVATECRERYGQDYFARLVVKKVLSLKASRVILKEARTREDILPAKEAFSGSMHIIEITAPQKIRFQRLIKRAGPKDAKTERELLEQEQREEALGFFGAAEMADFRISNAGIQEDLYKRLDRLMEKLTSEKSGEYAKPDLTAVNRAVSRKMMPPGACVRR